jgi:hypothetical protein
MSAKACPKASPNLDGQYARAAARLKKEGALWAADRPPPKEAAPALSAAEQARRLRDLGPAAYLYGATAAVLGEGVSIEAWRVHLDDLLKRMGVTAAAGPVARMLAVQLVLADHALGRLHLRAAARASAVETAAYHAAIGRLMGESRRTALALKACTAGAARRAAVPRTRTRPPSGVRPTRRVGKDRRGKLASNGDRLRGRGHDRKPAFA